MKPYSEDLRQRVVSVVDQGQESLRQSAQRFDVSLSFITRLLRRRRQSGSVAPKPHAGGQTPAFDAAGLKRLEQLVQEQPDATLAELQQRSGVRCSLTAVWRALRKLRISRKKKTLRADERDSERVQKKRQTFQQTLAKLDPEHLVFVDESGATTAMTRTYGRALKGQRVYGSVPGTWRSVTLISAVRRSGVVESLAFPGATDTAAFRTYVERLLAPQLRPGDVVIWDNLKPHQDAEVIRAVEATGAKVEPAPPWSPDRLPIEKMWSKVKGLLRKAGARCTETLYQAMGWALDQVRPQDIRGWFESCGLCATKA